MVCRLTHRRLQRNHREMGRTIARRLIRTLHLAEKSIPRFRIGHLGHVALVSAPARRGAGPAVGPSRGASPSLASVGAKSLLPTDEGSRLTAGSPRLHFQTGSAGRPLALS
jgi:hypothetical protein